MFSRLHNVVGAARGAANAARAAARHGRGSASRSPLAAAAANINLPQGGNIHSGSMRSSASIVAQASSDVSITDWTRMQGELSGDMRPGGSSGQRPVMLLDHSVYASSRDQLNMLKRVIDENTRGGRTLNMSEIMTGCQGNPGFDGISLFRQSADYKKLRIVVNERGDILGRGRVSRFNPENYTGAPAALLRSPPTRITLPLRSSLTASSGGSHGGTNLLPGDIPPPPRHAPPRPGYAAPLPAQGAGGARPKQGNSGKAPSIPISSSVEAMEWEGIVVTGAGNRIGKPEGERTNNPLFGLSLNVRLLEQKKQAALSQPGDTSPLPPSPSPRAASRADTAGATGGEEPAGYNGPFSEESQTTVL